MERETFWGVLAAAALAGGCKSDLNQQLLERELRMQEDQIYRLQDELQDKCQRLSREAVENASLRRQLGIVDADASLPTRINVPPAVAAPAAGSGGAGRAAIVAPPVLVPPAIDRAPPAAVTAPAPAGGAPPALAPPSLDGVPPLPADGPAAGGSGGPAFPSGRQLSYEQSLGGGGSITHLVINPVRTECFDGDGDGRSDGVAIVFEPRDDDERLVTAAGDVSVIAIDPAAGPAASGDAGCVARWDIPAAEAIGHFRRTSRARGLHFVLRWPDLPPRSGQLRLLVRLTTFEGRTHEAETVVPTMANVSPSAP